MSAVVSAIAAIGKRRELGKDNKLIWHIPDDLKRFQELTTGHPVIMGRKTFESILGYKKGPLKKRINIVVTRDKKWHYDGVVVCHSVEEAIETAKNMDKNEVFVIGGTQIFESAMPLIDRLHLTIVDQSAKADSFFPPYENTYTKQMYDETRVWEGVKYRWIDLNR